MSGFPGSPRLMKGALIGADPLNPLASICTFQINPETMTRKLAPRHKTGDGDRGEALRLEGPPKETISFSLELDATNGLAAGAALETGLGITPQLAALEMMIYPKSLVVIGNIVLAAIGTIEILPANAPLILFVWGPSRVLPVRIGDLSIVEQSFDINLNPLTAKVDISLDVLSYQDLQIGTVGQALSIANQIAKEVFATVGSVANVAGALS